MRILIFIGRGNGLVRDKDKTEKQNNGVHVNIVIIKKRAMEISRTTFVWLWEDARNLSSTKDFLFEKWIKRPPFLLSWFYR